ncbi:MAG: FAD binding domain-containing protein [Caldilineales bacterium]|nr:FAD binding domain-containing protein [Caldilineales bacterium]
MIKTYHRPASVEAALELLARPGVHSAVLAGGTHLNAHADGVDEVVDLQAVGLEGIRMAGGRLTVRSMTRLQALVDAELAPDLIRHTAHSEGPNTFRNQATVGGVVAGADAESELLAALLVFEADVRVQNQTTTRIIALPDFLADVVGALDGGIITEITLATGGKTAGERVTRTPADKPIVAVVGRKTGDGRILFAACGVAPSPILIDPDQLDSLDPPADFRGSSEYRREMVGVLARRAAGHLGVEI